ncbi:ABC transporter permease [bacterium]|nr:ABC transporter permease [bacterium]
MIRNYIKIALRNLLKHRVYSAINIFGLSVGIACCILIFLFVKNEWSYDSFHANKERLYRVYASRESDSGEPAIHSYVPMPLGPTLKAEYPEIEATVRFKVRTAVIRVQDNLVRERVVFTDSDFFSAFSFEPIVGVPATDWLRDNSIVLSRATAEKYFPDENPVDRAIYLRLNEDELAFVVKGVLKEAPQNSTIRYDFLANFERLSELSSGDRERADLWSSHNTNAYVLLRHNADASQLERKLPDFVEKYYQDTRTLHLQPIQDVHLNPSIGSDYFGTASDPLYSYILAGIVAIVLLIACINFMTLAVGQSAARAREVGTRKVMGAARLQLMKQFWGEAILMSLFAFLLGVTIAELLLPTFNTLTEKELALNLFSDSTTFVALSGLILIVGLIAGGYPALLMSGFQPIEIFREKMKLGGSTSFGRVMVVVQFSLSIFLIVTTLVMKRQQEYLMNKNLGYDRNQVVIIPTIRSDDGERLLQVFQQNLKSESRILGVSGSAFSFDRGYHRVGFQYNDIRKRSYEYRTDYDYLSLLGLELTQGRNFSREYQTDPDQAAIVNEAFVKMMEWENPIGESFTFRGRDLSVVGVVRDYHFQSLHNPIDPVVLHLDPETPIRFLLVRLQANDVHGGIELLREKWQELASGAPFEFYFLDDDVARQYRDEQRWDKIVAYSSVLAIVIACLGLFGLSALSVSQRTKEIGVRKVLGASVPGLIGLINREFLLLVLLGSLIAWPVGWLVMSRWLENFAYRIEMGPWMFALGGGLALVIALLTVSTQAIRTALANPVDALRYE